MDRRQLLQLGIALGLWSATAPLTRGIGQVATVPHLDGKSRTLLNAIAEVFIPTTDTMGAGAVNAADFIDLILTEWLYDEERDRFVKGLAAFDQKALQTRGKPFLALSPADQSAYVVEAQAEGRKSMVPGQPHAPFIVWMRRFAVFSYYTSEVGASQELQLNLIPGAYDHCAPIHAGDRAFSLDRHNFHLTVDNEHPAVE